MEAPFTKEEIDNVVKNLLMDKSPGPDGFTNNFVKECWDFLAPDFYKMIDDFFKGTISMQSINGSFIALIPKKDAPVGP